MKGNKRMVGGEFVVLRWATVSWIQVQAGTWVVWFLFNNSADEILVIPPETTAHANSIFVDFWFGVARVTADEPT